MKSKFKKSTAWLLTLAMLLTMLPSFTFTAFAADATTLNIADGSIVLTESDGNKYYQQGSNAADPYTGEITITGTSNANSITVQSGEHNVVLSGLNISAAAPFDISAGATVNLYLDGTNMLTATAEENAGLHVPSGATLNIYEKSVGGSLTAIGNTCSAGIGSRNTKPSMTDVGSGNITIFSGTITAQGCEHGAGIGGASYSSGNNIAIHGGTVTATTVRSDTYQGGAAGIGGGLYGSANVTITGGFVTATGLEASAGIGGGGIASGVKVTISGGTVIATGGSGAAYSIGEGYIPNTGDGIVTITGGSVLASKPNKGEAIQNATNGSSAVSVQELAIPDGYDISDLYIKDGNNQSYNYGLKDVQPIDGKVYLYLPEGVTASTECPHTPDNEIGQTCQGYWCTECESWYGEPAAHMMDPSTGKCKYDCGTQMAVASVTKGGTTVYYTDLYQALPAVSTATAADNAVIKLEADFNGTVSITGGVFTFDLNGHGVQCEGFGLHIQNAIVTLTDTRENGSITATGNAVVAIGGSLVIEDGIITSTNSRGVEIQNNCVLTITGGTITGVERGVVAYGGIMTITGGIIEATGAEGIGVETTSCDAVITGGSISGNTDISGDLVLKLADGKTTGAEFPGGLKSNWHLSGYLGEGMAFWQGDKMIVLSEEQTEITGGNVVVKKVCDHEYEATDNGDGTHDKVCDMCGYVVDSEPHTIENHVCTACGAMEIVVSFNAGDYEWKTGDQIRLLRWKNDQHVNFFLTAEVTEDGTVTWTPDKKLYWDGKGEHTLVASCPNMNLLFQNFQIPEDQSDLQKLKKADCMNAMWSGNPTTDPITLNLKHRLAKVTVNYEVAEGVTISKAEVYTLTQYMFFDVYTLERKDVAWEEGYDLWINSYLDGNRFTAFVSPDAYAADGNFIKITLSDGSVREVKMNKAVTFEEGAEYTYKVVITADGAYLTCEDECSFEYTDNGNGTHKKVCSECGYVAASENHTLTYTTNGSTITESCSANCGYSASLTLKAPANLVYDRTEKAATVEGEIIADYKLTYSADAVIMAGDYTATLTVGDYSVSLAFTIAKADPDVATPTGLTATYGQTLADVELPGGWAWKNSSASVGSVGSNTFAAIYTPANISNFNTLERDLTVVVAKAMPTVTAPVAADDLVYNGTAQTLITAGTATGGTMQYSLDGSNWSETIPTGKDAKTYTVYYKVVGDSNHNDSSVDSVQVTIGKATLTVTADSKTMTTGQELPTFTYTITGFVGGESEDVLTAKPTVSCEANGQTAGTYDITVSGAAADNYDFTYMNGTLSVVDHEHAWTYTADGDTITAICSNADGCLNATQTIKLIAPASLVYDGSEKAVTVEGTIDGTSIEVIYFGDRRNVTTDGFSASVTLGSAKAEISGMKITPAPITITGLAAMDRTYDGTMNVMLTGGALNGVVANDDVTIELTGASIVMADKNVSTNKPVSISGITLGGTAAGNYELLEQPSGVTVNITAAPLTIKSATIADVLYREDGNYTLMVTGVEFDGLVNGENLTLDTDYTATAQLTGANTADTAVDATVTVRLSNSNYSLVPNTCSAKVNLFTHKHGWSFSVNGDTLNAKCSNVDGSCPVPQAMATIQLVAPSAENLVYNGQPKTVTVAQTPDGTFSDLPVVSYCCTGGCINAGEHTAKLTYRGVTAEKKFTIAQKDITGANFGTFAEMTYNGAAQTPSATVTIDGLTVTGAWSGVTNVSDKTTFTASGNFAGTIADQTTGMKKAAPTAADFTFAPPANPVYDGSEKAASVTTDKSGMGVISIIYYRNGGDAPVTPADAGEYLVAINVTEGENYLSASSLRAESWKFTITQTQTAMTAKTDDMTYVYGEVITVTGTADVPQPEQQGFNLLRAFTGPKAQQVALYDASGNQLTDGVDVVNGAYTITYDTKLKGIDPGQELTLTVQFVGDANMSNRSVATNKFTLNAKSISPVVSGTVTKAYDGTTAVPANHNLTISLTDKIEGDTVNASGSFAYADAIVGTGKAINATGIILSGTDAKFYMLSTNSASSAVGEITKAKLNGVTAPADQTLNVYCMNATAAIAQLPTTVTYSVEGGGTIALNISWSCDSYNNTPNAENTFTWSVNDTEKLACYAPNTGVATSGSINVKNSAAIPVTLTGTPVTITYSGTTYDVSAMFTIGQGAGTPSYEIVTGGTGEGTLYGSALTITKAGTFTVKLTTAANGAYAASTATAVLTVEKGIPTVTTPTGLAAYYSQTLSQITLPADANGTWSWADGNTLVGEVGQRVHKAIFTPKDTNLWHAIYVDVTINVVQAGTVFVGDVGVYNGETATKAFTYGDTITVKVKPAAAQPATFSLRSLLAPQKDQMALYIRANGTDTQITNPVTADKNGIFTMEYVTTGKALVIGNNKLVAKYVGNDNMAAQEQESEVTLAQKELSFVSITAQSRAYEQGNNQVFVTGAELNGVESGDSVTLDTAGLTASVSSDAVNTYYSAMLPAGISLTGNDAGYYFITGSVSVTVAQGGVEITEKQPAALTFELSQTSFVYNRNEQKPTVTIKDGEIVLTAGVDYDITWPENCIDVGEKAILITFKGNYSGETTLTYEIVAQIPTIIVKQPTDQFVVEGQRAEFSIEATGAGLTYQWFINRNDGRGWRDIEGAIGTVYVTSVTDLECDGFQYGCLITDQYGNTLKSDVAVLHVSKVPVLPETGDSSTPMLWLAMSILSMACILLLRKKAYSR